MAACTGMCQRQGMRQPRLLNSISATRMPAAAWPRLGMGVHQLRSDGPRLPRPAAAADWLAGGPRQPQPVLRWPRQQREKAQCQGHAPAPWHASRRWLRGARQSLTQEQLAGVRHPRQNAGPLARGNDIHNVGVKVEWQAAGTPAPARGKDCQAPGTSASGGRSPGGPSLGCRASLPSSRSALPPLPPSTYGCHLCARPAPHAGRKPGRQAPRRAGACAGPPPT